MGPVAGGYITQAFIGRSVIPDLDGQQYQFSFLLFFGSNVAVLLLIVLAFAETQPSIRNENRNKDASKEIENNDTFDNNTNTPQRKHCRFIVRSAFQGTCDPLRNRAVLVLSMCYCLFYATINAVRGGGSVSVCMPISTWICVLLLILSTHGCGR